MSRDKELNALHAVLDLHHDSGDGLCNECSDGFLVTHPCPTVRAIQDALGEDNTEHEHT